MTPYVIFGTHPLFGDYADSIHACGGIVSRVVRNTEEPPRPPGTRFEDRLARYHGWLDRQGISRRVEVLMLDDFKPRDGERFIMGFWGPKQIPLIAHLKRRFGLEIAQLIHPAAVISPMSLLGEGVVVSKGAIIGPNTRLGDATYINTGAAIGHDCELGPGVIVSPGAAIASAVRIERGAIVGMRATILEELRIGEECYIAAGAVVTRDVPAHVLVAGVPAVVKKPFFRKPLLLETDASGHDRSIISPE